MVLARYLPRQCVIRRIFVQALLLYNSANRESTTNEPTSCADSEFPRVTQRHYPSKVEVAGTGRPHEAHKPSKPKEYRFDAMMMCWQVICMLRIDSTPAWLSRSSFANLCLSSPLPPRVRRRHPTDSYEVQQIGFETSRLSGSIPKLFRHARGVPGLSPISLKD